MVQIAAVRRPELCAGLLLTHSIGYDLLPRHDTVETACESFRVHYRPYARDGGGGALARQVAALDVADTLAVQDALPGLHVAARVAWGTADQFQQLSYGERFARELGTTVRRIEGGRHFTPEDPPASWPTASPGSSPRPAGR